MGISEDNGGYRIHCMGKIHGVVPREILSPIYIEPDGVEVL